MLTRGATWVVTTGEAGMRSQAMGLASAIGLPLVEKRVSIRAPWRWLPSGALPLPLSAIGDDSDPLSPPWPRLIVCCGRRAAGAALLVKRLSGGRALAAFVQNPELARARFDLVVAMPHDGVTGRNVVTVGTALHPVTPDVLARAGGAWRERLLSGRPRFAGVLIGGDNANYRLSAAVTARLLRVLAKAHAEHGLGAAITPSRRTGEAARRLIADAIAGDTWATMWNGTGENPYLGILALAERLIVTGESISMISEALATGRPVHILPLEGRGRRHESFLARIVREKLVSPIAGDDLDWSFAGPGPVNATAEPAARLRAMLARQAAD